MGDGERKTRNSQAFVSVFMCVRSLRWLEGARSAANLDKLHAFQAAPWMLYVGIIAVRNKAWICALEREKTSGAFLWMFIISLPNTLTYVK